MKNENYFIFLYAKKVLCKNKNGSDINACINMLDEGLKKYLNELQVN